MYSINGKHICSEDVGFQVQDMIIKDDYCILAVLVNRTKKSLNNSLSSNSSNRSEPESPNTSFSKPPVTTASKIIFKEIFE